MPDGQHDFVLHHPRKAGRLRFDGICPWREIQENVFALIVRLGGALQVLARQSRYDLGVLNNCAVLVTNDSAQVGGSDVLGEHRNAKEKDNQDRIQNLQSSFHELLLEGFWLGPMAQDTSHGADQAGFFSRFCGLPQGLYIS